MDTNNQPVPETPSSASGHLSRRRFIQQSGIALTTAALSSRYAWAVDTAPKKLRMGIVGGRFGLGFYFQNHPDSTVEASVISAPNVVSNS